MENRSHALIAGLFTLLLLAAGAIGAVWVSKKNIPLMPYELVATSPVTGLSVQSAVRYQGVPVGRVYSLRFMPDKPGQVRILIGVDPKTPLTESSWAEIVTAGVMVFQILSCATMVNPASYWCLRRRIYN